MKETPILFQADMVRAILDGNKTQTRRIGKLQKSDYTELGVSYVGHATKGFVAIATYRAFPNGGTARWGICECPYGIICDRLWVKETHYRWGKKGLRKWKFRNDAVGLERDGGIIRAETSKEEGWHKRPSIFMPRTLSRITLEITNVRAQRLQDIGEEDAEAEGIQFLRDIPDADETLSAIKLYEILWDSINLDPKPNHTKIDGKKQIVSYECYPWSNDNFDAEYPGVRESGLYRGKPITIVSNPWVWAITFKKL